MELIGAGENSDLEGFSSNDEDEDLLQQVQQSPNQEHPPSASSSTSTAPATQIKKKNKKRAGRKRVWKIQPFNNKEHHYHNNSLLKEVSSPLEYLTEYFDEKFYENAANCSNMYHFRHKGKLLNSTPQEIKKFFGIHLVMGCIPYPRLCMYWRTNLKLQMITSVMSRDRFLTLRSAFHLVESDTAPPGNDNPLWKVQPILDAVKRACLKIERVPGHYSIDEQMIPFTGRCALRQVVKNKPRPTGLKNFVLTTSEGLMLDFDIYRGAKTGFANRELGLGPSVILHLAKNIPPNSCVYFDRYFTTIPLLERLAHDGLHGTGTIMLNRIAERNRINIKSDKAMQRGEIIEHVADKVVFVKWMDKKAIYMASNCTGAGIVTSVPRWDKNTKTYVEVKAPEIVTNYNKHMGGVDVLDQLLEYYRTFIKTRKWTLKVIIHFIDLAVVNSWRLYRNQCIANNMPARKIMDLLKFRLDLAETLLCTPAKRKRDEEEEAEEEMHPSKRYIPVIAPSKDKRYDGYDHLPAFDDIASPRCCRHEKCVSRSKIRCVKCNVYLCLSRGKDCFREYHVKK